MASKKPLSIKITAKVRNTWTINGHTLTCTEEGGAWTFSCPSFPDLSGTVPAGGDYSRIVAKFMKRCLAKSLTGRALARTRKPKRGRGRCNA